MALCPELNLRAFLQCSEHFLRLRYTRFSPNSLTSSILVNALSPSTPSSCRLNARKKIRRTRWRISPTSCNHLTPFRGLMPCMRAGEFFFKMVTYRIREKLNEKWLEGTDTGTGALRCTPRDGFAITGPSSFEASQTAINQTQGVHGNNFVPNDNFTDIDRDFPGQPPHYLGIASTPNVFLPTPNYGFHVPNTVGLQMDGSFLEPSVPVFDPRNTQGHGINSIVPCSPYMSNYAASGYLLPFQVSMDDLTINAPFMPNHQGVGDISDWASLEGFDNTIMDNSMFPNTMAMEANILQQPVSSIPQASPAPVTQAAASQFQCNYCQKTFKRDADRIRHENSKHLNIAGAHICQVTGCPKSQGRGYTRSDKLTEHMWKKHGNLGYTKRT